MINKIKIFLLGILISFTSFIFVFLTRFNGGIYEKK